MNDNLDETNYRRFAKKAIEAYSKKDMLVDSMLWSAIIGYYEAALKKAGVRAEK